MHFTFIESANELFHLEPFFHYAFVFISNLKVVHDWEPF